MGVDPVVVDMVVDTVVDTVVQINASIKVITVKVADTIIKVQVVSKMGVMKSGGKGLRMPTVTPAGRG
jgi:hypothetical protein